MASNIPKEESESINELREKKERRKKSKDSSENEKKYFFKDERFIKITGLFFILFSVFLLVAFTSYLNTWYIDQDKIYSISIRNLFGGNFHIENMAGKLGAMVSHFFFYKLFGISSYILIGIFFMTGISLLLKQNLQFAAKTYKYGIFFLIWVSAMLGFIFTTIISNGFPWAGFFGISVNEWLASLVGKIGAGAFLLFIFLGYLVIAHNVGFNFNIFLKKPEPVSTEPTIEIVTPPNNESSPSVLPTENNPALNIELPIEDKEEEPNEREFDDFKDDENTGEIELEVQQPAQPIDEENEKKIETNYDPTLDLSSYQYPGLDLLENYGSDKIEINKEELEKNSQQIILTLRSYAIEIKSIKATIGPTVTLYEIVPAEGIRISKIKNLEDDIALSLAALGIRIIAPIPGKGTIGIEVPNLKREIVSMRSLLDSEKFKTAPMDLPVALGKTISNEIFIADLAKMPHLLIAGATGQGKSVGVNAILVSLLYKKHPSWLKFVMIDPKRVELSIYKYIEKHFLAKLPGEESAIITDTKKVINTLNSLCIEMDTRYDLLTQADVRTIREYNEKFIARKLNPKNGHHFLPFIVLVVDEFADLILTAGKEIETPIARLAQMARAVGIHLVIATQRPSVNVITGTIKANFPARIAFKATSKVDSRTILDIGGAEQLVGRGDMLIALGSDLTRLQCAFVDTPEVERIVEFIAAQQGYPEAFLLPEYISDEDAAGGNFDPNEKDEFFEEAARLVVTHQQGSTSLIQRRMKLGYNRAGRIMDQLEQTGIVGQAQGSKAREVLIKDLSHLEQKLREMNGDDVL